MADSSDDEMPELVPAADMKKVPISVITGFLGKVIQHTNLLMVTNVFSLIK